jgi:hypothetical protein
VSSERPIIAISSYTASARWGKLLGERASVCSAHHQGIAVADE